MKYRFRLIFLFIFVHVTGAAQYGAGDIELLKSVFNRQFDTKIINQYLNSAEASKRNAGLLAVANSADSAFIPAVIQTAPKSNMIFAAFALARLGESIRSSDFLLEQLSLSKREDICQAIYSALGKTGNRLTLEKIISMYKEKKLVCTSGISLAIHYFLQRNIQMPDAYEILKIEISDPVTPVRQKTEALFALARNTVDLSCKEKILNLFAQTDLGTAKPDLIQYFSMAMRKYGLLPASLKSIDLLIKSKYSIVRIEAAKLFSNFIFSDSASLFTYMQLLKDTNPNVRMQCAISLKNLKQLPQILKFSMLDNLISYLHEEKISASERQEVFSSIIALEPQFKTTLKNEYESFPIGNRLKIGAEFPELYFEETKTCLEQFSRLQDNEKITCLLQLGQLSNSAQFKPIIDSITARILANDPNPVLLAGILDGIDSGYVVRNQTWLRQPISKLVAQKTDDPQYAEIFNQLLSLPETLNIPFLKSAREILKSSKIRSVQQKFGTAFSDSALFNRLASFIGRKAKIKVITTSGQFVLELSPEIAPLSSANLLYLINQSYFNDIKFHRVVPGFVIQTGDPTGTGSGGPGFEIISELSPAHYFPGVLGMARSNYDTEGSQWFVTTGEYYHLDGNYTVFGKVIKGLETAEQISENDRIININILEK